MSNWPPIVEALKKALGEASDSGVWVWDQFDACPMRWIRPRDPNAYVLRSCIPAGEQGAKQRVSQPKSRIL